MINLYCQFFAYSRVANAGDKSVIALQKIFSYVLNIFQHFVFPVKKIRSFLIFIKKNDLSGKMIFNKYSQYFFAQSAGADDLTTSENVGLAAGWVRAADRPGNVSEAHASIIRAAGQATRRTRAVRTRDDD